MKAVLSNVLFCTAVYYTVASEQDRMPAPAADTVEDFSSHSEVDGFAAPPVAPVPGEDMGHLPHMVNLVSIEEAAKRHSRGVVQLQRMPEPEGSERLDELSAKDRRAMPGAFPRMAKDMPDVRTPASAVHPQHESHLMNTPYEQRTSGGQRSPGCSEHAEQNPSQAIKDMAQRDEGMRPSPRDGRVPQLFTEKMAERLSPHPDRNMVNLISMPLSPTPAARSGYDFPTPINPIKPPKVNPSPGPPGSYTPAKNVPDTLIFVAMRVPAWSPIMMSVDTTFTTRTVKMILEARFGLHNVKLFYQGRELYNETTFEEAGVKYDANINVVPQCEVTIVPPKPVTLPSGQKKPRPPPKLKNPCKAAGGNSTGCPIVVSLNPDIANPLPKSKCIDGECKEVVVVKKPAPSPAA